MTIWQKMQKVDRRILYTILMVLCSAGLFIPVKIPTDPDPSSKDLYKTLMAVPQDKTLIIQSDWTNSTRGESMGHFENLMRFVMTRNLKFVVYSAADPIAPSVARTVITRINAERKDANLPVYRKGADYLELGYFPNAEATNQNMATNLRSAWAGRKTKIEGQTGEFSIWETDVLRDVKKIEDAGGMVVVTASASIDIAIQRLSKKVPISAMVTGVVGPTVLPFYQAGQVKGIAVGLKGVYDMEYLAEYGINHSVDGAEPEVTSKAISETIPPLGSHKTWARGQKYYGTLHIALVLLILAVILGNVAMFMSKKQEARS
ncbi:hypothetical protein QPK87_17620 [Kamptonema cortianum]|nr:hypothetical protein [Geitlerinema splendidum]MDK3158374.1 hypothetical protein [Kamptonema cortianum]